MEQIYEGKISDMGYIALTPVNVTLYKVLAVKADGYDDEVISDLYYLAADVQGMLLELDIPFYSNGFTTLLENEHVKKLAQLFKSIFDALGTDGAYDMEGVYQPSIDTLNTISRYMNKAAIEAIDFYAFSEEAAKKLKDYTDKAHERKNSKRGKKGYIDTKDFKFNHDTVKWFNEFREVNQNYAKSSALKICSECPEFVQRICEIAEVLDVKYSEDYIPERIKRNATKYNQGDLIIAEQYYYLEN